VPPTILTGPALLGKNIADLILQQRPGSRGNALTKLSNDIVIEECFKIAEDRMPELRHIGGGTLKGKGEVAVPETYIRGPAGRLGSSNSDGAFELTTDDQMTAHFNTTSTRQDGTLTKDEAFRDARLTENLKRFRDRVVRQYTIRKLRPGDDIDAYRAEARALCNEIIDGFKAEMGKASPSGPTKEDEPPE